MVCASAALGDAARPVLAVCAALAAVALAAGLPLAVAAQQQQQQQPLSNARPSAAPPDLGDALFLVTSHSLNAPFVDQNLRNQCHRRDGSCQHLRYGVPVPLTGFDFGGDARRDQRVRYASLRRIRHFLTSGRTFFAEVVDSYKHIRLTPDRPSQMGWLWSKFPLTVPNWQVEFEFRIGSPDKGVLFGDGLAFWATTERSQPGPVFGNKQNFTGLGVFIDTYANGRNTHTVPYIIAMLGDGRTEYDQKNDGENNKLASCEANVRNKDFPTRARIKYTKGGVLEVDLLYKSSSKWTRCFDIKDIALPIAPYIGFTAVTGAVHGEKLLLARHYCNFGRQPPFVCCVSSFLLDIRAFLVVTFAPVLAVAAGALRRRRPRHYLGKDEWRYYGQKCGTAQGG
ncbi:MAG: LOW QUALITY PROTEIN: legume-like lectin family-domain-containing protein [Olpidium bornovanus]|uniref:Legume-like lectin family-domain-containing protein n=1 Tax=Olpidium bornovanus TaxID=278681 RepID=A0A8H8DK46_9FUNG|nr:MAG: LOW QUALITY PROTEIN: legume-like lectin family-domain-containing protein [Olpidium bornovanus]